MTENEGKLKERKGTVSKTRSVDRSDYKGIPRFVRRKGPGNVDDKGNESYQKRSCNVWDEGRKEDQRSVQ